MANATGSSDVLSESEISRYIKSVTIQIQVVKYLGKSAPSPKEMSVFGSPSQRSGTKRS